MEQKWVNSSLPNRHGVQNGQRGRFEPRAAVAFHMLSPNIQHQKAGKEGLQNRKLINMGKRLGATPGSLNGAMLGWDTAPSS